MTRDDYLALLNALLPPGSALLRDGDGVLAKLLGMPAGELARVEARAIDLLNEADPRTTNELLAEWEAAYGLPDDCSPLTTFLRASTATWFDASGTLRTAQIDEARPILDPVTGLPTGGTLVEGRGTNTNPNPRAVGAVAGTPGTLPTGWTLSLASGLSREVIGAVTVDGSPGLRIRLFGTPSVSGNISLGLVGSATIAASAGQVWASTAYYRLHAGSLSGITFIRHWTRTLGGGNNLETILVPAMDGVLRRYGHVVTCNAGTTSIFTNWLCVVTSGVPIDATIDVIMPQIELGAFATSPILPPPGTIAASTREPDILTVATTEERRAALVARIVGAAGQSRAYFIALAATLGYAGATVEEFRMARVGRARIGDAVNSYEWSQAWRLRLGATAVRPARVGGARAGDSLVSFGDARIECAVRRTAPAHTLPLFAYGP